MKQQQLEAALWQIVDEAQHHQLPPHLCNLITKAHILLEGGDKAASVECELANSSYQGGLHQLAPLNIKKEKDYEV